MRLAVLQERYTGRWMGITRQRITLTLFWLGTSQRRNRPRMFSPPSAPRESSPPPAQSQAVQATARSYCTQQKGLVRIRDIWWGSGSPRYLCVIVQAPDPTPDPTPFFSDFKDAKKKLFFSHIFSYNLPAGTLSSVLKISFFAKILCTHFILQEIFQSAQHIYEKGKYSDPDPYLWLMDPDPGGTKTCGSGYHTLRERKE